MTTAFARVFARPRNVCQRAGGPVEIPLPGFAEGLTDVLDEVAIALLERRPTFRAAGVTGEDDAVFVGMHGGDVHAGNGPLVESNDFHVAGIGPIGANFVALELELIGAFARRFGGRFQLPGDLIVALLGQAWAEPPAVVHEQLGEVPLAFLHLRQFGPPAAVTSHLPTGDPASAAQNGPFVTIGRKDGGRFLAAGSLGAQRDRLLEKIPPAADCHDDRAVAFGLRLPQRNNLVDRMLHGGPRAVGTVGIRLRSGARPPVVALGRHEEIRGFRAGR